MENKSLKSLRFVIIFVIVSLILVSAKKFIKTQPKVASVKKEVSRILERKTEVKKEKPGKDTKPGKEGKAAQLPAALEQLLGGGGAEQEKIPVRVYKVAKSDFQDELSVVGTIKSIPEIDLKFEINGRVTEIRFKEGQKVKNGDLVAKLDQKDAQLELEWVKAKYEAAKAEADSVKKRSEVIEKLFQTGAIIEARVEEARAEIKAAEERAHVAAVEIKSSQARLEKTNLYASQNGIMGPRDMDAGEFITPQDRIGTLLSEENMFVEVGIIEKDIYKIQVGQRVVVNVDAYPKTDFYGVVDNIFPVLEGKTRTLNVRVKLIESRGMLLPGMFARSRIAIYSKKEAIIVPTNSVTVEEKRYFAACIEDEKVKNKEVFLEYLTTDYAVVKTGIKEGDLVIVETPGLKKLKDGTPVDIMEMQEQLTSGS